MLHLIRLKCFRNVGMADEDAAFKGELTHTLDSHHLVMT